MPVPRGTAHAGSIPAATRRRFLEELTRLGSVSAACASAGVNRSTAYHWRATDPEMAAAWDVAQQLRVDLVREELVEKALAATGRVVDEPVRGADGEPLLDEDFELVTERRLVDYDRELFKAAFNRLVPSADGPSRTDVRVDSTTNVPGALPSRPRLVRGDVEDAEEVADSG